MYCRVLFLFLFFFFFKQKTAYEMRISDWSSDVCSSDLTSKARTRISEICGWLVANTSARLLGSKKSTAGSMPTRASSGSASSRMRPLGMAKMIGSGISAVPLSGDGRKGNERALSVCRHGGNRARGGAHRFHEPERLLPRLRGAGDGADQRPRRD